jgi:hypothetical protein
VELIAVAEFSSRAEAEESAHVLHAADIPSVVDEDDARFHLRVDSDLAHAAMQVLRRQDHVVEPMPVTSRMCPECGSHETRELPPYALMWGVFSIILLVLLVLRGRAEIAFPAFVVAWLVASWLSRYTGKRRCPGCGWLFSPQK